MTRTIVQVRKRDGLYLHLLVSAAGFCSDVPRLTQQAAVTPPDVEKKEKQKSEEVVMSRHRTIIEHLAISDRSVSL